MKNRIMIIIAVIVIACFSAAYAEEFTIHSGVQFGMTADEAQALESAAGFNLELFDLKSYVIHDWDQLYSLPFLALDRTDCSPWYFAKGQIAGVEKHTAVRYILVNGVITQAQYEFGWVDDSNVSRIVSALLTKYGTPAAASLSFPKQFDDINKSVPDIVRGMSFEPGKLPLPITYANADYSEWCSYHLPDENMETDRYSIGMGESGVDFYLTWIVGEGDQSVVVDAAFITGHQVISGDHGSYQGLLVTYSQAVPSSADASVSWTDDL